MCACLADSIGLAAQTHKSKSQMTPKQHRTIKLECLLSMYVEAHGLNTSHNVAKKSDINSEMTGGRCTSTTSHVQTTLDHSKNSAFFVVYVDKKSGSDLVAGRRAASRKMPKSRFLTDYNDTFNLDFFSRFQCHEQVHMYIC